LQLLNSAAGKVLTIRAVKPALYKFRMVCCFVLNYTLFTNIRTEICNLFLECHIPE